MKTILAALEFPPAYGGVETYYAKLSQYWPEELSVIDNHSGMLVNSRLPFLKWLPALKNLFKVSRDIKPDWIIAGEILPIGTVLWLLSHFNSFKYAVFLHGLDFSLATASSWKRFVSGHILKKANLILCANSLTGELAAKFLGSGEKIRIVNPGIDPLLPTVRSELSAGLKENYGLDNKLVLLTTARLVKRKGIDTVLRALPEVLAKEPNLRYVIIGKGPEENFLKQTINELDLSSTVILLTNVSDAEKWAWLDLTDIFIMTAHQIKGDYEGFGIVYLEANLFGKPVIAGRSGGVSDAVIDHLNGLLVNEGSEAEITQAILELSQDEELRIKLGSQGKDRALKDFAWPDKIKEIYDLLKQTI